MPAAFGCITSSPGSADCNRRVSALRCLRFNAEGRVVAMLGSPHEYDQVGPVAMGVEVSPTGSRSASKTPIGHEVSDRQDRSHAVKRAGTRQCAEVGRSCRPGSGRAWHQWRRLTKFLGSATPTIRRASLLTRGLL